MDFTGETPYAPDNHFKVKGGDYRRQFLIFSNFKEPSLQNALNDALQKAPGAVALANATAYAETVGLIIYSHSAWIVEGTPVYSVKNKQGQSPPLTDTRPSAQSPRVVAQQAPPRPQPVQQPERTSAKPLLPPAHEPLKSVEDHEVENVGIPPPLPLPISEMPDFITLTDDNFAETIKQGIVLVSFTSDAAPVHTTLLCDLARELKGKAVVAQINHTRHRKQIMRYGIKNVPTFIVFENGEPMTTFVGLRGKAVLLDAIHSLK